VLVGGVGDATSVGCDSPRERKKSSWLLHFLDFDHGGKVRRKGCAREEWSRRAHARGRGNATGSGVALSYEKTPPHIHQSEGNPGVPQGGSPG